MKERKKNRVNEISQKGKERKIERNQGTKEIKEGRQEMKGGRYERSISNKEKEKVKEGS